VQFQRTLTDLTAKPHARREFNYRLRNLFRGEALGERSAATKMNAAAHFEDTPPDDYSLEAERKIGKLFACRAINLR
jgi:hypothetical protein